MPCHNNEKAQYRKALLRQRQCGTPGEIIMITGIEHIAVCAKDTAALKDWYVKMFDFKVVYDNGKGTFFVAAPDGSMIEIIAADKDMGKNEPNDSGVRHFALSVTDDGFDKMVENSAKPKASGITQRLYLLIQII